MVYIVVGGFLFGFWIHALQVAFRERRLAELRRRIWM